MDLEKIYTDCRGKYFPHLLIIRGALEASPYRNSDVLLESTPFTKKGRLHVNSPLLKRGRLHVNAPILKRGCFSCHKAPTFLKWGVLF